MTNTKNLASLAAVLDDGTSGQVLQSTGSGGVQFADSTGSGVTVHANQAAMLTDAASASEGSLHYETGTNKLYVKQTSGFYLLASITNVAPTIDSFSENTGGAGANNLTAGGTFTLTSGSNTVITINATEPDLETISYSATVTSGTATDVFSSPSFPVSNQSSNVFTLTPVTSGTGGTVTIRFDASDGTNVANVSHSFEIVFQIANSHFTSLLVATDGSAGDNNDITDSSSNNHTITVTGDAYAGTFSPYRHGGYSAYMGGNGNYISTTHATSLKPSGTDDFCVSLWYWPNATPSTNTQVAGDFRVVSYPTSCNGWDILHLTSDLLAVRWGYPNYIDMNSGSTTVNIGEWNHIVYCKNNSTMSLFLNGTRVNTTTSNIGMTASTLGSFYIGYGGSASGSTMHSINGYITDFKLDIGGNNAFDATATSITVPTERATLGNNTKLFACHLPYLKDGSTSDHTLSFTGSSTGIKPFGPYDYNEYSATDNGGSIEFDGNDDLSATLSSAIGTGDFSISGWYYTGATPATYSRRIFTIGGNTAASGMSFIHQTSGVLRLRLPATATNTHSYSYDAGQWVYFCIKRSSGTLTLHINGEQEYSGSDSTNLSSTSLCVGNDTIVLTSVYGMEGNLADFKICTSSIEDGSVPTSVVSSSGSILHLKGTDAHVIDKSQGNNLKLVGTAASTSALTSGSTPPYIDAAWANTSAVSFDGNSDYVQLPVGSLDLGSSDFTLEAWIYQNANSGTGNESHTIYSDWLNTNADKSFIVRVTDSTGQKIQFLYTTDGSTNIIYTSTATISNATWTHVAVCKDSTSLRFYKDGAREVWVSSPSFTLNPNDGAVGPVIGGNYDAASSSYKQYFDGYIQDLRVTKGLARYTAADESSNIPSSPLKG